MSLFAGLCALLPFLVLTSSAFAQTADIPARPEQLVFPELTFDVPEPGPLRAELDNGVAVYIIEDRAIPLLNVEVRFRGGRYLVPSGKEGLAQLTATVWRSGGAGELSGAQLDEEVAFLAAGLGASIGATSGGVSLNALSKDLDRGFELLMDLLLRPRFEQQRLDRARTNLLASMRRRNDDARAIESREWSRLMLGEDFWANRLSTQASVDSITRSDLIDFHRRLVRSDDMVVAVAGDFDRAAMLERLNATVGAIPARGDTLPEVPQPTHVPRAGVYLVDKPDVNQGRVSIGHPGLKQPVADEFDLRIAADVLGGGSTSWIFSRVRSDEGLAYSASASYGIGTTLPGTFRARFQSESTTVARAAQLVVELIGELRDRGFSRDELVTSQNSFVETFPNGFANKFAIVSRYANDQLVGREEGYWTNYRDRIRAVSTETARAAARRHMRPEDLVILVVGNIEEILKGNPGYPDASLEALGPITLLPLRNPMTGKPLESGNDH